jgi:hypothetical protein
MKRVKKFSEYSDKTSVISSEFSENSDGEGRRRKALPVLAVCVISTV